MTRVFIIMLAFVLFRTQGAETNEVLSQTRALGETLAHLDAKLSRQLDTLLWFEQLNDVAQVEKVLFTGPPPKGKDGIAPPAGSNEVIVSAFTFMPKKRSHWRKIPLLVLAHGEIHGNVASDDSAHVVRELVQQGYAVVAPDYRGSSGYGADFWHEIDYGGLEIEDVHASRKFMLGRYHAIDARRVGIIGWSHGGLIALLTIFAHPDDYQVCYAGVPVSDLEERLRIRGKGYEELFSAPYHLCKTFAEAPEEYRRRSPAMNASKLKTPLLIHTNTSDEDVTAREVQRLIDALRKEQKDFAYKIYTNAPGGHYFNRLDTVAAGESRMEIWQFLAKYLHPPRGL